MSAEAVVWGADALVSSTDEILLERAREGSADAFGELWRRHLGAALLVAGRHRGRTSAEDIVAAAATRVFALLRQGRGPDENFRAYFLTTVRSVAVDRSRQELRDVPADDETLERLYATTESDLEADFDPDLVRTAFRGLSDRDQQVLWHTTVEGSAPRAVAPLLGLTPNSVSVRAMRAREALRALYLDAVAARSAGRADSDECRWALDHLGAHVQGRLRAGQRRRIEQHVAECGLAADLADDLRALHEEFGAFIGPLVLLAGVGMPHLFGAAAAGLTATATATATASVAGSGAGSAVAGATAGTSVGTTAGAGVATTTTAATTTAATTTVATTGAVTTTAATTTAATTGAVTTTAATTGAVTTGAVTTTAATMTGTASVAGAGATTAATSAATASAVSASSVASGAAAVSTVSTVSGVSAVSAVSGLSAASAASAAAAAAAPAVVAGLTLSPPVAASVAGLMLGVGIATASPVAAVERPATVPASQTQQPGSATTHDAGSAESSAHDLDPAHLPELPVLGAAADSAGTPLDVEQVAGVLTGETPADAEPQTDTAAVDPVVTDPVVTDPAVSDPVPAGPVADPVTDPITDPAASAPTAGEPGTTDPAAAAPASGPIVTVPDTVPVSGPPSPPVDAEPTDPTTSGPTRAADEPAAPGTSTFPVVSTPVLSPVLTPVVTPEEPAAEATDTEPDQGATETADQPEPIIVADAPKPVQPETSIEPDEPQAVPNTTSPEGDSATEAAQEAVILVATAAGASTTGDTDTATEAGAQTDSDPQAAGTDAAEPHGILDDGSDALSRR